MRGVSPGAALRATAGAPMRGVDLSLDKFDLSETTHVEMDAAADMDACANVGEAFWSSIAKDSESLIPAADRALLRAVFNPSLSDRKDEGDLFVPPESSAAYMEKLRNLTQEEAMVRDARCALFFSAQFTVGQAGPLFPSSWTSSFRISGASPKEIPLAARPDYKAQASTICKKLASAAPSFEQRTEDGEAWRVYHLGNLEVRTTQACDGEEVVGQVFQRAVPAQC